MADIQIYTVEAAATKAANIKTALIASKVRFYKEGLVLTAFTTATQFLANECDFDNYTAAGYPLAAWTGPINDPNGGAILTSPLVNVAYIAGEAPNVGNVIGGWWIVDAGGNVRLAGTYDPPRPMNADGMGFPWVCQIVEARNPTVG